MSLLRILGIITSIILMVVPFILVRNERLFRSNLLLAIFFGFALLFVSLFPSSVNIIRDLFQLGEAQNGRIIALLIVAVIMLTFLIISNRSKLESLRNSYDGLVRSLTLSQAMTENLLPTEPKPIYIIIPAYNEEHNLQALLPEVPETLSGKAVGVLVIDDGSTDGTRKAAEKLGSLVVSLPVNRGQGAASRLGYDIVTRLSAEIAITMDADNQHRPENLQTLISPIIDEDYDLVIGSRILEGNTAPKGLRGLGVKLFSLVLGLLLGRRISDCSSGFKAFRISKLRQLKLLEDQFQSAEVLIQARVQGFRVKEVPITIDKRKYGCSKKGADIRYGFNFAKSIFKSLWR